MSKKNQRKNEKLKKFERLIDANELKRTIEEAAKAKGTEDAMKKAKAYIGLIDLQPTVLDERDSLGRTFSMMRQRALTLESDLALQKITQEQYNYEMSLIDKELKTLEVRFGIPVVEVKEPETKVEEKPRIENLGDIVHLPEKTDDISAKEETEEQIQEDAPEEKNKQPENDILRPYAPSTNFNFSE